MVTRSGGLVTRSGGLVTMSGGLVTRSGGLVTRSGGLVTRSGGAVVIGVFLLWLVGGFWFADFGFGGSGCRRYGQRAWLRIDLLGLRVLTAPCPAPPGFRYAKGASSTRQRRIFDFRRNDPVSSTGQAGGRGRPSRGGGETRRTGLCGTGDITDLCDSQRCNGIRRAVRHRRICDHVR